jgi:hypothetical protein
MKHAIICSCLLIALAGCKKGETRVDRKLDACALLTRDEIQAVQGSTITDAKSSERSEAGLRVSQCYFAAQESNKSVSLVVTQTAPDAPSKRAPKDYWQKTFARGTKEKEEGNEKGERESAAPTKIKGVGDDAYWIEDRVGGALYALKDDVFIRISLGGPDDPKTKLDKSKTLARKALERL